MFETGKTLKILLCCCALAAPAAAGEAPAAPSAVLDLEAGSFRAFLRWKTPALVDKDGKLAPLPEPRRKGAKDEERKPLPVLAAALPPQNWTAPDFDDSVWPRARGAVLARQSSISGGMSAPAGGSNYFPGGPADWQMLCLRGVFLVNDPQQVKDLRLALRYHGGAAVYLNGQELQRGHLPAGKLDPEALAERYPEEAYLRPDGKLYLPVSDAQPFADRLKCRVRELPAKGAPDGVAIPESMLKKGLNVIAIEVHTAPVSELAISAEYGKARWQFEENNTTWAHAAVLEARLTSASGAGLGSRAGPCEGVGLFNCQPIESVEVWDCALPGEVVRPIRLVGALGGSFSGKAVLSSASAIRRPRAAASDLAQEGGGGKIPASAVQIRWAEPAAAAVSFNRPQRFDRLLAEPPAEAAPVKVSIRDRKVQPTPAAVLPVWVTVRVPGDAPAGTYKGTVTIEAEGSAPAKFAVPVELKVHGWKLPDPRDFASHHNFYQSPDTLAQYYKVPPWSDRHFELIGRSLAAFQQLGGKICVLNLAIKVPSLNNTESMVRWVKKPGGGYDYDFTIADKYLDVYAKTCGKPAILQLNVWGFLGKSVDQPDPTLAVTVFDPESKKLETLSQPAYGTPENEAFWKPVLTELRKRLEGRGWYDVAAVCYTSYCWQPTKEMVGVFKNIWPDGRWMNSSHSNPTSYPGPQGSMPVPYCEYVWGCGGLYNPDGKPGQFPRAWKQGAGRIEVGNPRYGVGFTESLRDSSALVTCRAVTELTMQGNLRGVGRVGGDFWPLPIGKGGKYDHLCDAFAAVGPANSTVAITSPGPDGAIFNERSEMFREGVQVAEAIIFLQKALEAKQVPGELAARVAGLLDERARYNLRARLPQEANQLAFEASGWQERDDRLFALAAEVARGAKGQ